MNSQRLMSSSHEAPLPLSAATSTRSSGAGSSSGTSGYRIRIHTVAGPGTATPPTTGRHSMADM